MVKINKEFQELIPSLTEEEYQQLEENLVNEGWRKNEFIVIWNDYIVDGHNRYEICKKNKIDYKITELKLKTKEDVFIWIIKNQFGRRNISPYDRGRLALRLKEIIATKIQEKTQMIVILN